MLRISYKYLIHTVDAYTVTAFEQPRFSLPNKKIIITKSAFRHILKVFVKIDFERTLVTEINFYIFLLKWLDLLIVVIMFKIFKFCSAMHFFEIFLGSKHLVTVSGI